MQHHGTDTGSLDPWWGREEQPESVNVPLMTGTGVFYNSEILTLRTIPSQVSKLVAMVTCP